MLTKFLLFAFFTIGYSQVLKNEDAVKSDNDNEHLIKNTADSDGSSQPLPENSEYLQSLVKGMSACCFDATKNISELMKKVSRLEEENKELQYEISELNRWENDLSKRDQQLRATEQSLIEYRTRLDREYEQNYKNRISLEKSRKGMIKKFQQLTHQQYQVSQCMNNVTFSEEENERQNAEEQYHLTVEEGRNLLYTCRSISDRGRNYLLKCLPSMNDSSLSDLDTEVEF